MIRATIRDLGVRVPERSPVHWSPSGGKAPNRIQLEIGAAVPEWAAAPRFDSTLDRMARNVSPIGRQSTAATQETLRSVVAVTRVDTMSILWNSPPGRGEDSRDPIREDYDRKRGRLRNATGRNSTNDGTFKAASRDAILKN
jgi:hypothetical protein